MRAVGALVDARARAMYDATYERVRAAAADVPMGHRVATTTRRDDALDDDALDVESTLVLVRVARDVRLADVDGAVMTTTTASARRRDDAATTREYRLGDFGGTIARAYDVASASGEDDASLLTASSAAIARELTLTRRFETSDDDDDAREDETKTKTKTKTTRRRRENRGRRGRRRRRRRRRRRGGNLGDPLERRDARRRRRGKSLRGL